MEKYEIGAFIGRGASGNIELVRRKADKTIFVQKSLFYDDESTLEAVKLEGVLQRTLDHPSIVRFVESFPVIQENTYNIIMQHCEGGDLQQSLQASSQYIPEPTVWYMFAQLVLAVDYLHQNRILHRDIKPQNVFLCGKTFVKLGDLGVSRKLGEDESFSSTMTGTPFFMSPEQIQFLAYSFPTDIWSLGCVLYNIITLKKPFVGQSATSVSKAILSGVYDPIEKKYSISRNALTREMVDLLSEAEPGADELSIEDRNNDPKTDSHFKEFQYSKQLKTLVQSMLDLSPQNRPTTKDILSLKQCKLPIIAYCRNILEQFAQQKRQSKDHTTYFTTGIAIVALFDQLRSNSLENAVLSALSPNEEKIYHYIMAKFAKSTPQNSLLSGKSAQSTNSSSFLNSSNTKNTLSVSTPGLSPVMSNITSNPSMMTPPVLRSSSSASTSASASVSPSTPFSDLASLQFSPIPKRSLKRTPKSVMGSMSMSSPGINSQLTLKLTSTPISTSGPSSATDTPISVPVPSSSPSPAPVSLSIDGTHKDLLSTTPKTEKSLQKIRAKDVIPILMSPIAKPRHKTSNREDTKENQPIKPRPDFF